MPLLEDKILTELSDISDVARTVQYVRGYFYAHKAGNYRFTGIVDDQMIMKMAQYPGNANTENMETILKIEQYSWEHFTAEIR